MTLPKPSAPTSLFLAHLPLPKLRDKLNDKATESASLDTQAAQAASDFADARKSMRDLKTKADEVAPMTPELMEKLRALSPELADIDAALEEMEASIASIADNPEVLRRYDERKEEMDTIRAELENLSEAKDAKKAQVKNMRDTWQQALKNTVEEVNRLFGTYMAELGCAGK